MSSIVIFGAGGRAGRLVVSEARARGYAVTAIVRDIATERVRDAAELHAAGVTLLAGDAADADRVAEVAAGHVAAISTIAPRHDIAPPPDQLARAHRALLGGLERASVTRLAVVGVAPTLEVEPGVRMIDTSAIPPEHQPFLRAHEAGLDALLAAGPTSAVDWVSLTPPMSLVHDAPRHGRYRISAGDGLPGHPGADHLSYADLAVALVDEAVEPRHHRRRIAVTD